MMVGEYAIVLISHCPIRMQVTQEAAILNSK